MKTREKLIMALLTCGIIIFCYINFIVIPKTNIAGIKYGLEQMDAATHDLNYILKYKHKYMGNASNLINLYRHLPLNIDKTTFQLFSDDLTLQVQYKDKVEVIGAQSLTDRENIPEGTPKQKQAAIQNEVHKSLLYNSTAAFALIDNLEYVEYKFLDVTYQVSRADTEKLYNDFNKLLMQPAWKEQVQQPLSNSTYVSETFQSLFKEVEPRHSN